MKCIKDKDRVHKINNTVSTGVRYSLYLLVALQVVVVLILVILLGISGTTLTHLNMVVEVCDNKGGSSTGDSTSIQTSGSCATPNVSCNCSFTGQIVNLTNSIGQVGQTIGNQLGQMMNQMQDSSSKLDDLQMFATQQTTDTQNASARLNTVLQTTGDTASKLTTIVSTLNNIETTGVTTSSVANDILGIVDQLLELQNASSIFNSIRPVSCQDIKTVQPNSPTGHYHVNSRNIYCNMDTLCSVTGGWTRIGYLDMSDATQNCPSGFRYEASGSVRTCGRTNRNSPSCSPSLTFPTNGLSYTKICGRVRGYQRGSTDAIAPGSQHNILNSYYLDGISITRGSPREHIWSFIAGVFSIRQSNDNCPCTNGSNQGNYIQSFVGNNYYCESGNPNYGWSKTLYPDDPLWDGQQCIGYETACCTNPYLPWFYRDFGNVSSAEGLELRMCGDEGWDNEDSPFELYEFYIQ